ncbi:endonuclease [Egicoccus sp. AB-alg2]|uniref:endonuclease n=1 Tax=Egicoccus sp. AB-alg2 TaxID=3242693 RepID=UPI00359D0E2F
MARREDLFVVLLRRHGQTFAAELGIDLEGGGADARFQLCVAALLISARISTRIAVAAARSLFDAGFTSARRMRDASWQQRVDALGAGGYVRYDESTATYLGDTAELLLERYDGDLEALREAAGREPAREYELLQECKGIGTVGANVFLREVQTVWHEVRPFADEAVTRASEALGLPHTARGLAGRLGDDDLSVLAAALVRADLADELGALKAGQELPPSAFQLASATKAELLQLARERDLQGRSAMSRDELADALRGGG